MKTKFTLFLCFLSFYTFSQYTFPPCFSNHVVGGVYVQGNKVSKDNNNYEAKYWTNTTPPSGDWNFLGKCGAVDDVLGNAYSSQKRIIGYMPTWNTTYNFNDYDPTKVTNVIVSFLEFKTNNNDFSSNNFASVEFTAQSNTDVDNVLFTQNLLATSHNNNVQVSVAIGGAIDYGFLWLMNKYHDDDVKLQEIAQYIVDYAVAKGIDGVDLDMECWWADPAISGTSDQGGRVRGDKWGGPDSGPHVAGIGLRKLAEKIKILNPNLLLSAAVFGTSWYGNNYDDTMASSLDWIGLMTYDFTGSWSATPYGPHTALFKVPLDSYTNQSNDNPIYSAQDALEYWQGLALPAWNHDGGFNVPRAKLCIGAPFYGYDFSTPKPNGGNGFITLAYKDIVNQYPNAPTSYDPVDSQNYSGFINTNGKSIYYETPQSIKNKFDYIDNYGHQGIIIWELTNDLHPSDPNSLLNALNSQATLQSDNFAELVKDDVYVFENQLFYNFEEVTSPAKEISVYNVLSQRVFNKTIENNKGNFNLNLSSGIYIVKYGNFSKKIYLNTK